jgi:hypothetical protein
MFQQWENILKFIYIGMDKLQAVGTATPLITPQHPLGTFTTPQLQFIISRDARCAQNNSPQ